MISTIARRQSPSPVIFYRLYTGNSSEAGQALIAQGIPPGEPGTHVAGVGSALVQRNLELNGVVSMVNVDGAQNDVFVVSGSRSIEYLTARHLAWRSE